MMLRLHFPNMLEAQAQKVMVPHTHSLDSKGGGML